MIARKQQVYLLAITLGVACSCSINKQRMLAEQLVVQFHAKLNAENFTEIYRESDSDFKQTIQESDAIALMTAVHQKLGLVKNSTKLAWFINTTPSGSILTLTYETEFTKGKATEQFIFRMRQDVPKLAQYNIISPELLRK